MVIVGSSIYIEDGGKYTRCTLRKQGTAYYLKKTGAKIEKLPQDYEVATLEELIARFGEAAIPDEDEKETEEGGEE